MHKGRSTQRLRIIVLGYLVRGPLEQAVDTRLLQEQVDAIRRDRLFGADPVELAQDLAGRGDSRALAVETELVAAVADLDAEPALDLPKVLVELAADAAQPLVVRRLERQLQ